MHHVCAEARHKALKGAWDKTRLFTGDQASGCQDLRHPNAWDHVSVVRLGFQGISAVHTAYEETHNMHIAAGATSLLCVDRTQDIAETDRERTSL